MNKKHIKKRLVFLLLLFIFLSNDVKVFAKGNPPAISSENAILMDGASGKILYSKNPPYRWKQEQV